jgi:hypothetical protein
MNAGTKRFLAIVLGTTLLACVLGIALDLVTANVAVEYFSVYHPHVVDTENPWILALVWGVIASWWAGAIAGTVVATVNHLRAQPLEAHRILRWGVVACVVLWLVMIAVLVAVYLLAGTIPEAQRRPTFEHDRRLMAVAMAHQFEYLLAGIAMVVIAIKTWWKK